MIDYNLVSLDLAEEFVRLARQAEGKDQLGREYEEQIVAAFLNNRMDWLPRNYPDPLSALKRLNGGGSDWWHTLLYVHDQGWITNSGREVYTSYKW